MYCTVCGGTKFEFQEVLWPRLVEQWQLSEAEARYINQQQGQCCTQCGSNLRSIALADALRAFLGTPLVLREAIVENRAPLSVLEINEAGSLTPELQRFDRYTFAAYPEVDIHALPYDDGSFDLVVHSDTLEHVQNPVHALKECKRVLRVGGALCFTVPVVVGRMSRDRSGLERSYHGGEETGADDFLVRTEFGADAWTYAMAAAFKELTIFAVEYPAALAFLARRSHGAGDLSLQSR